MKAPKTISESLEALTGQSAWGLQRTVGSMFFLEFGQAVNLGSNSRGEPRIHGEWHFLFELCSWSLRSASGFDLSSNDLLEAIDSKFASLSLGSVSSANFSADTNRLDIQFTSESSLTVTPDSDFENPDDIQWLFFIPGDLAWRKTNTSLGVRSIYEQS